MEIEKRSMESGSPSAGNYNVRLFAKILVALVCFILVLFSFIFMDANSYAADSKQKLDGMATITLTGINTLTATSTPTSTPTATGTPTHTPTATNTPRPSPTGTKPPRRTPTATATLAAETTAIPTATATGVRATSTVGTVTSSPGAGLTPTSVPGVQATTTTNDSGNGTPPAGQQGSGLRIVFFPFVTGALLFVGMVIVLLLGFLMLRKHLLPPQPLRMNLPPSGAQPWRRVHTGTIHSNANIAVGDPAQDSGPTLILPAMYADSSEPATEKVKLVTRRGIRLVKLEETRQET